MFAMFNRHIKRLVAVLLCLDPLSAYSTETKQAVSPLILRMIGNLDKSVQMDLR
jgi:hypothetical protein